MTYETFFFNDNNLYKEHSDTLITLIVHFLINYKVCIGGSEAECTLDPVILNTNLKNIQYIYIYIIFVL